MKPRRSSPFLVICLLAVPVMALLPFELPSPAVTYPPIVRGLAQLDWSHNEDRATLGVEHFYAWGETSCGSDFEHCTPMNRNGTLPQVNCYPTMLLFNEPTNPEPAGHPLPVSVAVSITLAVEAACPDMQLVIGNIHLNNLFTVDGECCGGVQEARDYLVNYLAEYKAQSGHVLPSRHKIGVHCYGQWADGCLARLTELSALPFSGQYWLTEFALYGPPPYTTGTELAKFLKGLPLALPGRIERAYIWTNRDSWPFDLVNLDGTLTAMGRVWADWQPPTVRQTWLPALNRAYP